MTSPPSSSTTSRSEMLSAYLEGSLDPKRSLEMEAEIERDPQAAKELRELKQLLSAMSTMPTVHAPQNFSDRVLKTVRRRRWLHEGASQDTLTLVFQILSILLVIGIAAAFMIAQMETEDRRILEFEAEDNPSFAPTTPDSKPR